MRLFIAEKPKMGREIAKALPGPMVSKSGYIETGAGVVTWCLGHLLEQVPPDAYDEKYKNFPGRFSDLPVVPSQWRLEPIADKKAQVRIIQGLLKKSSDVVNAGDPGREGQLIVDEVLHHFDYVRPVYRLLLYSLDKATVQKALAAMDDNRTHQHLYHAALGRQRADWLVGMNLTRSYTILGQQQNYRGVLSIGRVQTPTLAIVVRRDLEIEAFKPKDYWSAHALGVFGKEPDNPFWTTWVPPGVSAAAALSPPSDDPLADVEQEDDPDSPDDTGDTGAGDAVGSAHGGSSASQGAALVAGNTMAPRWLDEAHRIIDRAQAQALVDKLAAAGSATVVAAKRKSVTEPPPLPIELTGLQARINAATGATVDTVLKAAQKLYEGGHLSYPRTDCPYLPEALHADSPNVLAAIGKALPAWLPHLSGADPTLKSRAWNDAKVGEHYGLIPTQAAPDVSSLTEVERAVYELAARRFVMQFYPPCQAARAAIELEGAGERWAARGRVVLVPGWRVLETDAPTAATTAQSNAVSTTTSDQPALPDVKAGDIVDITQTRVDAHTTKPPPRFTEGALTMAMKHVDRLVTDPVERKKLKVVEGIGRSATRAAIINTLVKRQFLLPEGKKIISSAAARVLVGAAPAHLVDPGLTARWEQALDLVAKGTVPLQAFMDKQEKWVRQLVQTASGVSLPLLPPAPERSDSKSRTGSRSSRPNAKRSALAKSSRKNAAVGQGASAVGPTDPSLEGKACSRCGKGKLRARQVRQGAHAGKVFYGCSAYPDCRHSEWPN